MAGILISGVRELDASIKALEVRMSEAARNFVIKGGAIVAKAAKEEFVEMGVSKSTGEARILETGERRKRGELAGSKYKGGNIHGARPQARTGKLRTSIKVADVHQVGPGRWMSTVGPTMVYGRRVELGFVGQDSRGRTYNQSPYPYMAPGFEKSRDELVELYNAEVRKALA